MRLYLDSKRYIDTNHGKDLSIPLINSEENVRAWYVEPPRFEPVRANGFVGSVAEGGGVNFRDVYFNPHGHGTHTECLGHITKEVYSINQHLKTFFFSARVVSVQPKRVETASATDFLITAEHLKEVVAFQTEALIIRTLPNESSKKSINYSATNPPYLDLDIIPLLEKMGVKHVLIDLPSVDREEDGGALAFHHAFWKVPEDPQFDKTISEMIYVPDEVKDGAYILNLQVAAFENDAAPSRPILFEIKD
jgi:kynurenine formamidase